MRYLFLYEKESRYSLGPDLLHKVLAFLLLLIADLLHQGPMTPGQVSTGGSFVIKFAFERRYLVVEILDGKLVLVFELAQFVGEFGHLQGGGGGFG